MFYLTRHSTHMISSKGSFYMHHPIDMRVLTIACVTLVVKHWLEQEIAPL